MMPSSQIFTSCTTHTHRHQSKHVVRGGHSLATVGSSHWEHNTSIRHQAASLRRRGPSPSVCHMAEQHQKRVDSAPPGPALPSRFPTAVARTPVAESRETGTSTAATRTPAAESRAAGTPFGLGATAVAEALLRHSPGLAPRRMPPLPPATPVSTAGASDELVLLSAPVACS